MFVCWLEVVWHLSSKVLAILPPQVPMVTVREELNLGGEKINYKKKNEERKNEGKIKPNYIYLSEFVSGDDGQA